MLAATQAESFKPSVRQALIARLKGAESRTLAAQRHPSGSRKQKNLLRRADTEIRKVLSLLNSRKGTEVPAGLKAFLSTTAQGVRSAIATLRT
jgi:hypothetical protein